MTKNTGSLAEQIHSYLTQLDETCSRWSGWLAINEDAALRQDPKTLNSLHSSASQLNEEIQSLVKDRAQILLQGSSGPKGNASSLTTLVRELPLELQSGLHKRIQRTRRQLANLQRLHLATWLLVHQNLQYLTDMFCILTHGREVTADVYTDQRHADRGGGQLLDKAL